jgi:hypothetical protein
MSDKGNSFQLREMTAYYLMEQRHVNLNLSDEHAFTEAPPPRWGRNSKMGGNGREAGNWLFSRPLLDAVHRRFIGKLALTSLSPIVYYET